MASSAIKGHDYFCPECRGRVRRRGGLRRQDHFFHIDGTSRCRQNGKSLRHIQVQLFFLSTIPNGECRLEHPFPQIRRIADVFWEKEGLVFEVQCSPISPEEVLARNRDYASVGVRPVWILHDHRYNGENVQSVEFVLKGHPHYFTNIDEEGKGCVYDQFSHTFSHRRTKRLPMCSIAVDRPRSIPCDLRSPVEFIQHRISRWKVHFSGDIVDSYCTGDREGYCSRIAHIEKRDSSSLGKGKSMAIHLINSTACIGKVLFRYLLERFCK